MKKILPIALWFGALLTIAIALLYVESDLLWKVQHRDLFLSSALFFKQTMVVSGGILSYLGAFFTQFFYYPWLGVTILCGWWLLLMWLTKRAFSIPDRWNIVALIPVAILLIANMDLGYWVYAMKLRGYFFSATIGTTASVALLWLFRQLPEKLWVRTTSVVLTVLAGYPLMGVYALATALLMGVWTWRLTKNRNQNIIVSASALLAIVAIPLFYYRFVYYQTHLADIYRTALPAFTVQEDYPAFYYPYYLLAVCFLAFVVCYNNKKTFRPLLRWTIQGALLAALVAGVWHYWYKDANFHHELKMQRCIEQADWEGVIDEGRKQAGEPTRAIVMMHNLALSRLGRQCDEMYNFPKGSKRTNTELPIYMFNTAGVMIYYQYGVMNEAHRLCMEEAVEYGWNVENLRYMARAALMSHEQQVARKYLDLLRQTMFYGGWADHMEELLNNNDLLAKDEETGPITRMMHYDDNQSQGHGYVEKDLMESLARLDADDIYFQEQAVLAAMWCRDPGLFWPRFEHYVHLNGEEEMPPRIFQEAAWLFANMQGQQGLDEWVLQPGVKESFNGFMRQMQQFSQTQDPSIRQSLLQYFGNTYYFEYFFLKNITYY